MADSESKLKMDALVRNASDKLEALEAALYGLNQINVVFTSEDGMIETTADGSGAVTGLWLDERLMQRAPKDISDLVIWASQQAVGLASAERAKVLESLNASFAVPSPLAESPGEGGG